MTKELKPRIIVIGVGGAGGNAVDNMIEANLQGVEFFVANTDAQAMARSKTDNCIQLGIETTSGLGAGARPEVGEAAAEESLAEIKEVLQGAHMVFVAAGMGGGTGTGASPVIAKAAHDMGILTIGVVTKPFGFEGTHRMRAAEEGLENMRQVVDTMIVVPNQNLFRVANERTTFAEAFRMADDILYSGVRGITDLMIMPGLINLDFADVRTIMKGMGSAMMGMGEGEGESRALEAARAAIDNPLLDDVSLKGARGVLINITGGYDMTLFELDEAANEIRREVDADANIILGSTFDPELEGRVRVSVVAAGLAEGVSDVDSLSDAQGIDMPPSEAVPTATEEVAIVVAQPTSSQSPPDQPPAYEADPRPDFSHRPLPAAHVEAQDGTDHISADRVLSSKPGDTGPAGFSNLFGWGRDEPRGDNDAEDTDPPIVTSSEAYAKASSFDDADLEIPAFLRRSANN